MNGVDIPKTVMTTRVPVVLKNTTQHHLDFTKKPNYTIVYFSNSNGHFQAPSIPHCTTSSALIPCWTRTVAQNLLPLEKHSHLDKEIYC